MCTITYYRDRSRILVTMNRDERLCHEAEHPPRRYLCGGMIWVAPRDGGGRNTWIGANSCGAVLALLKASREEEIDVGMPWSSRLAIIPTLLELGHGRKIVEYLENDFDPTPLSDFSLLVLSPGSGDLFAWTRGKELLGSSLRVGWSVWTSSSYRPEAVANWRRDQFYRWRNAGAPFSGLIPDFNLMQVPEREAWSPLMRRSRSGTRNITQIEVHADEGWLEMRYWPEPTPEYTEPQHVLRIPAGESAECYGNRSFA